MELVKFGFVMFGGALGAAARYGLARLSLGPASSAFPWTTFTINVLGSLMLGLLVAWARGHADRAVWVLLLGTGLCGGFTTFSTFSVETLALLEQNRPLMAVSYILASVLAALLGAWLGSRL